VGGLAPRTPAPAAPPHAGSLHVSLHSACFNAAQGLLTVLLCLVQLLVSLRLGSGIRCCPPLPLLPLLPLLLLFVFTQLAGAPAPRHLTLPPGPTLAHVCLQGQLCMLGAAWGALTTAILAGAVLTLLLAGDKLLDGGALTWNVASPARSW